MESYTILSGPDEEGKVSVRRASDGKVAVCKRSWLVPATETTYHALNRTKAIRLDGLEWTTKE